MERAEVVVIGGGVIGTSIAFHLAEAGVDVLPLERGELGSGSTSKGAGGIRAMFSDELNVRIGLRDLHAWAAFGDRPGWEVDFEQVGYLFLLSREEDVRRFERDVATQGSLGLPSRIPMTIDFETGFYFHRRPVRDDARPQRPDRRGAEPTPLSLRHRLLRTRVPAGTRRGRDHPRP